MIETNSILTPNAVQSSMPARPGTRVESVVAAVGFLILLSSVVLLVDRPPLNERTDFSVTYLGGRMVYLGLGPQLYDLSQQARLKRVLLPDAEPLIFEHPPFEALLLAPLGALPYKTAYLLWGLLNAGTWVLVAWLLRPHATVPADNLGYMILWLLFLPLWAALFEGQSSVFMLLVYVITFLEFRRGHDLRSGAVFGLALMKFQFAIPFALIFLLRRKWRFLGGFALTACGLGVLSLIAAGWSGIASYLRLILGVASHPENASFGTATAMATVTGFVSRMLGGVLGHTGLSIVAASISIGLLVWTARRWNKSVRDDQASFSLMFAAAIVVSIIASLHMFTPDLSPALLAMLLALRYFPARHSRLRIVLGAVLLALWMPPLYLTLLAARSFYLFFPILLLFVWALIKAAEDPSAGCPLSLVQMLWGAAIEGSDSNSA